jgi:putative N6-adenine-specific DNA methylase
VKVFDTPSRIIVTCNKRITPFLEQEIVALGFNPVNTFGTGVELVGTVKDCIRLNLNLRCASQVLYSIKTFAANSPDDVYKTLVAFPWETLIPKDGYLTVTSYADHFTVNNGMFVNVKVKDAIVDRMLRETAQRPDSGPAADHTVIHLYWKEERAEIFIDTAGETLGKHGYRKIPGKAPMQEALASATLMATKWDRRSPFINPMCGSSTVAVEAVLLATDRRPGLFRANYSFMHILGYDPSYYADEYNKLNGLIKELPELKVYATDLSDDAIDVSKANAVAAGIENYITFYVCDFELTKIPESESGVIYFNPEYGERLGDVTELEATYARIGDFLKKKCKGYTGYVFTGNLELAKKIGLKASRRIEFYNSQIDCRLLEYELYSGTRKKEKVSSDVQV